MDSLFNRLLSERLFPIVIEQAETDDPAKKADLEKKIARLRGLTREGAAAGKLLDWKAQYEALRRDADHVRRRLENLKFAENHNMVRVEILHFADEPKAPVSDPRWIAMVLATAAIVLTTLAVGLGLDQARTRSVPPEPVA